MICYQLMSMWGIRVKENGVMFSCMLTLSIFIIVYLGALPYKLYEHSKNLTTQFS